MYQMIKKMKLKWSFFAVNYKLRYDIQTAELKIKALQEVIYTGNALIYLVNNPNEV